MEQSADVKNGVNQRAAALLEAEKEATAAAEEELMNYKLKKGKMVLVMPGSEL